MKASHHVHIFLQLLKTETAIADIHQRVRIRTAKEYAGQLGLHPNYLNSLLKEYTGTSISIHIKNQLLEKSKNLLLQTDWTLQYISYRTGFANRSNFIQFFKSQTGATPNEFRKMARQKSN